MFIIKIQGIVKRHESCINHLTDLVPLKSIMGLMENWQNSSTDFGVRPEIKQPSLLPISGTTTLENDLFNFYLSNFFSMFQ